MYTQLFTVMTLKDKVISIDPSWTMKKIVWVLWNNDIKVINIWNWNFSPIYLNKNFYEKIKYNFEDAVWNAINFLFNLIYILDSKLYAQIEWAIKTVIEKIIKNIYEKYEWKVTIDILIEELEKIKKSKWVSKEILTKLILVFDKARQPSYAFLRKILNSTNDLTQIIFENNKLIIDIRELEWFQIWNLTNEEKIILSSILLSIRLYLRINQNFINIITRKYNLKKKIYTYIMIDEIHYFFNDPWLKQLINSFVRMIRNAYWSIIWLTQNLTDFWDVENLQEILWNFSYRLILDTVNANTYLKSLDFIKKWKDEDNLEYLTMKKYINDFIKLYDSIKAQWNTPFLWILEWPFWKFLIERKLPKTFINKLSQLSSWI